MYNLSEDIINIKKKPIILISVGFSNLPYIIYDYY